MTHPSLLLLKGERKCENNFKRRTDLSEASKSLASSTLVSVIQLWDEKTIRIEDNNDNDNDDDNDDDDKGNKVCEGKIVKILNPGPLRLIEMHP